MASTAIVGGVAVMLGALLSGAGYAGEVPKDAKIPASLGEQNQGLWQEMQQEHSLSDQEVSAVKAVFAGSRVMGQGNPSVTKHAMTRAECRQIRQAAGLKDRDSQAEQICGDRHMAPLYDPKAADAKPEQAQVCIDRYEYPNIPCSYPVVWVRADEAQKLCQAVGKRLCDAHEWEGACAGQLLPPDYDYDLAKGKSQNAAVKAMRAAHNRRIAAKKTWAFGPKDQKGVCAMNSFKHKDCNGGDWQRCGSNTYPTGAFPNCRSSLGVFDQHGNAAEHMNLPLAPDQAAQAGTKLGVTEMKGSWFIFDKFKAHQDHCRWRAPFWHGTTVMHPKSHHNYHLGFRCCKDVTAAKTTTAPSP